jgi:hypothetical protein
VVREGVEASGNGMYTVESTCENEVVIYSEFIETGCEVPLKD